MKGAFCILQFIYCVALFYVLTPGMVMMLPSTSSSKMTVTIVHGIIFALVMWLVKKMMSRVYPKGAVKK